MSANPFGSIFARVETETLYYVISNRDPMAQVRGRSAGIDRLPQDNAYLLIDENQPQAEVVTATLVAYIKPGVMDLRQQSEELRTELETFPGWLAGMERIAQLFTTGQTSQPSPPSPQRASDADRPTTQFAFDDPGTGAPSAVQPSRPEQPRQAPTPPPNAPEAARPKPTDDGGNPPTFTFD
jgi:hypothetical protein